MKQILLCPKFTFFPLPQCSLKFLVPEELTLCLGKQNIKKLIMIILKSEKEACAVPWGPTGWGFSSGAKERGVAIGKRASEAFTEVRVGMQAGSRAMELGRWRRVGIIL